ncbi:tetratricopeptide repeat protein 32 [Lingula anatina]|uniref:Tetratricopeptide repeat protein 32 n=1 Tax=Lingula anatina TaxID=7574 RepID=A0A1S3J1I2_LINAN|nr:tetratricopeptide repeat protein 32 [Lingula anatina]|eukprot:XP_013404121.2 tetratricopeptide repeat protein 32 [Lingula anatina]
MEKPNAEEALQREADNLRKLGQNKDAENKYSECIRLLQDALRECGACEQKQSMEAALARAYNDRGFVKYLQVEFKSAVEDYTSSLELKETEQAYYNRGLIKYRLSYFDEAIQDQQRALRINPDFKPAEDCLKQSIIDRENGKNKEKLK